MEEFSSSWINPVDLSILGLLLYGLIRGARRGLSRELARLAGLAAILFAGWYFYRPLGEVLLKHSRLSESGAYTTAFLLVLAAALVVVLLLRLALQRVLAFSFRGLLERGGGALAGGLQMLIVGAALIYALGLLSFEPVRLAVHERSWFGPRVMRAFPVVYGAVADRYAWPPLPVASDDEAGNDSSRAVEPEVDANPLFEERETN
jgi:uncharacterized membrane protein required for colicin V production